MDREKRDIIISWATITLAFASLLIRFRFFPIVPAFITSAVGVGLGFILHELAHKYVSIHYGAHAEFRMWPVGLVLAIVSSFFGAIFAAPGAVYILEPVSRKQNGVISLAGPLTNILIGIIFLAAKFFSPENIAEIFGYAADINFFLAFFNMIPIYPLDGSKVLKWNGLVWAVFFIPLFLFIFLPGFFGF